MNSFNLHPFFPVFWEPGWIPTQIWEEERRKQENKREENEEA